MRAIEPILFIFDTKAHYYQGKNIFGITSDVVIDVYIFDIWGLKN